MIRVGMCALALFVTSITFSAAPAAASSPYDGDSTNASTPGILGTNNAGGDAVFGYAPNGGRGVVGVSDSHTGVEGDSTSGAGVWGASQKGWGVFGAAYSQANPGIFGTNNAGGDAVFGYAPNGGRGVVGVSDSHTGVEGDSTSGPGVWGATNSQTAAAVSGYSLNPQGTGPAIYGQSNGNGPAGLFKGNVVVTGSISANGTDLLSALNQVPNSISNLQSQINSLQSAINSLQSAIQYLLSLH